MKSRDSIALAATAALIASCGSILAPAPDTMDEEDKREVVITATPMPAPTATLQPALIFEDDFEAGAGEWPVEEIPEPSVYVSDGQLIIEVQESQTNTYSRHPDFGQLDTYVLDVDISYLSGPTGSEAGIAFRCDADDESWLEVSFDADGFFTISSATDSGVQLEMTEVIPYALIPAIRHGQAINHLRLVDDNSQITVSINDALVTTFPYEILPPGCPALFAGTFDEGGAKWAFDNVSIREIDRPGVRAAASVEGDTPAFANTVARQLSALTVQGLRSAVGAPALAHAPTVPEDTKSAATEGAYRVDCPSGGHMEMMQLPDDLAFIEELELDNAAAVFTDCAYIEGGSQYTVNGTLAVSGSYYVDENEPPMIQVAGELTTSPGEDCPIDGRVTADGAFAGTICAWPITIDPMPPPPAALTPAELLAGPWSGRARYRETSFGCSGDADFTFVLEGSGEDINGTYTYRVGKSTGPDPLCSRSCDSGGVVGCRVSGSLNGSAGNGSINFTAGGLAVEGTYRYDGQWMVGHYEGSPLGGIFVKGDWQTILK